MLDVWRPAVVAEQRLSWAYPAFLSEGRVRGYVCCGAQGTGPMSRHPFSLPIPFLGPLLLYPVHEWVPCTAGCLYGPHTCTISTTIHLKDALTSRGHPSPSPSHQSDQLEHSTSNIQHPTFNIQHPTSLTSNINVGIQLNPIRNNVVARISISPNSHHSPSVKAIV
jgi:hypothetical protein